MPINLLKSFWKNSLHYIAFYKYAYEGMFKNEFEGLTFCNERECEIQIIMINREDILRDKEIKMDYSNWMDLVFLLGMVIYTGFYS